MDDDVHDIERAKWDEYAEHQSLGSADVLPEGTTFREHARTDSDLGFVIDEVADFMGPLEGCELLEYCCGRGILATLLARSGAKVSAFDISQGCVDHTRLRAELNGTVVNATVAAAEKLPYADETFDVVFGTAALHHVDVSEAGPELYRVLKPGGRAVFLEPMGVNPILRFARDHVPYPDKNPRGADRPLNREDIRAWGEPYSDYSYRQFQLLSMLERGFGFDRRFPRLRRLDDALLERFPPLRAYARLVVLYMTK